MNVYLIYLVLDDTLKTRYPYLINPDTIQYGTDGISVSLYGFTDDKDKICRFMNCRSKDIFYYKKKKVKKKEYSKFRLKYILYELNLVNLDDWKYPISMTKFEEMISTDASQYVSSIEQVVSSSRYNLDKKSLDYLKKDDLTLAINQVYNTFKSNFDFWLRYFAPTIDIKSLYSQL